MIKMSVKNIEQELERVLGLHSSTTKKALDKESDLLLHNLKLATPVDTGLARDSWLLEKGKESNVLSNPVEYIEHLNNGSSKQAPAYFIESTVLERAKPVGTVVTILK
jgi:hypothetical protein